MRQIIETARFKSDLKKIAKSGRYNKADLVHVLQCLADDIPLHSKYQDHILSGKWNHHRECHIKPDWLLIYKIDAEYLRLVRTGKHSDLFE